MKKYYLSLALSILMTNLFSQTSDKKSDRKVVYADFAYATPSRDTLFLSNKDDLSRNTYITWQMDPTWKGVNPVILFVPQEFIDNRKSLDTKISEDTGSTN